MWTKQIGKTVEIECSNPDKPYHTYEYTIPPKTKATQCCRHIPRTPKIHISNIPRSRFTSTLVPKANARSVSRPIRQKLNSYHSTCTKCGWQNKITI